MKKIALSLLLIILYSCDKPAKLTIQEMDYYNLDSLLNAQLNFLKSHPAKLTKEAMIGSDYDKQVLQPDSAVWKSELEIFKRIDVNKPAYQNLYQAKKYDDDKSNLKVLVYTSLKKDLPISHLKIYYLGTLAHPKRIAAEYMEHNPVYSSLKVFNLYFDDINGTIRLREYECSGYQKMLLKDSIKFSIKGKITY